MNVLHRRPRIAEIAARAGVSTATVDRVINGRVGVRSVTVVAVLTNIPSTNVLAYIGLDNRAAGRTADLRCLEVITGIAIEIVTRENNAYR